MAIFNIDGELSSRIYDINGNELASAYDISGNVISEPYPLDYTSYTTTDLFTYVRNGFNGFDVHRGIIVQYLANNSMYMFDLSTHATIATGVSCTSDHGDSVTFSPTYYADSDEFPLIYVTSDTTPAKIYINRITRTSSTLIRTLVFPSSAGYYGAGAYDFDNDLLYLVSYKENNYRTSNNGANTTVVTKWDLNNLTDNGDGTYTPVFISSYERDFIYVMQGMQYFDGYIWIASGYNDGGGQYIYAMNPNNGVIAHTITLDDTIEIEGLAWVYDSTENKYWMLIGQQNGSAGINYSRIDFATASS